MILIPRYRDLRIKKPLSMKYGVGGEFRLILRNSMGGIVQDTGWFDNYITDAGLYNFGNDSWSTNFHIGSDNTAPAAGQTALISWLAASGSQIGGITEVNSGSPNYVLSETFARRFSAGLGTGTIRELGISKDATNTNMSIRALVSPEVVKASNQMLDVYYKFSIWRDLTDSFGTVTIDGIDYDYTARVQQADTLFNIQTRSRFGLNGSATAHSAFDGPIGTILESPSGSSSAATNITDAGNGLGYRDYEVLWGVDVANFAGGIRSIEFEDAFAGSSGVQIQFESDPGGNTIPKLNTQTLMFEVRMNWARH